LPKKTTCMTVKRRTRFGERGEVAWNASKRKETGRGRKKIVKGIPTLSQKGMTRIPKKRSFLKKGEEKKGP